MIDYNWPQISVQLINIIFSVFVVIYFIHHTYKLSARAQTQRFIHLYPYNRGIFVLIFVILNIAEIIILVVTHKFQDLNMNSINVTFTIGTIINSAVLIFQVYVMRLQIKKEYPYSYIHRIYWIYLPCVIIVRIILGCIFQKTYQNNLSILILNIVLFIDCFGLAYYSIFFKRQEIQEFQKMKLFELDNKININLLREETIYDQPQLTDPKNQEIFPLLNIELKQQDNQYVINVYCRSEVLSRKICSFEQIEQFYHETKRSYIKPSLIFERNIIESADGFQEKKQRNLSKVKQFETYINKVLSQWENYTPQVLDFLSIPQDRKFIYLQECKKMQHLSKHTVDNLKDISSIYFDKMQDHYQFAISVRTWDGKYRNEIQKRYTQIQELDKKLKLIEVKINQNELKIKTPEFPEKHYFHQHDSQILEQRKQKLQLYLRRVLNDKNLMKYKETNIVLFEFIGINSIPFMIQSRPVDHYKQLSFQALKIVDQIQEGELVTYYAFKVSHKTIYCKQIKKRYKQFNQFHKELKRWMHNSLTQYKNINLPPKLLNKNLTIKQKENRHKQLCHYLNIVANTVQNITDLYQFKLFLQLENFDLYHSLKNNQKISQTNNRYSNDTVKEGTKQRSRDSDLSSNSMSIRIDELGDDI